MAEVKIITTLEEVELLPVGALIDENIDGYHGFHLWRMVNSWKSVGGVPFNNKNVHLPAAVLYDPSLDDGDD